MARILNSTRATVVAEEARTARSAWSRFWGLMGKKRLVPGRALVIDPCSSIHTMFMRFPIDVIFLDRDGRVVKVARNVRPYRAAVGRGSRSVVELPAGDLPEGAVNVGDVLAISD